MTMIQVMSALLVVLLIGPLLSGGARAHMHQRRAPAARGTRRVRDQPGR